MNHSNRWTHSRVWDESDVRSFDSHLTAEAILRFTIAAWEATAVWVRVKISGEYQMYATTRGQLQAVCDAFYALHFGRGNPHNQARPDNLERIEVAHMAEPATYWWLNPDLQSRPLNEAVYATKFEFVTLWERDKDEGGMPATRIWVDDGTQLGCELIIPEVK